VQTSANEWLTTRDDGRPRGSPPRKSLRWSGPLHPWTGRRESRSQGGFRVILKGEGIVFVVGQRAAEDDGLEDVSEE